MEPGEEDKSNQMMNWPLKCPRVTIPNSNQSHCGPPILIERTITNQPVLDQIHSPELLVLPKQLTRQKRSLVSMVTLTLGKKLIKVTSEGHKELI
jgi:hypothetical protein